MPYMGLAQDAFPAISAETASRTLKKTENGKIFTNRGASGAVTLTLPPIADVQAGWNARFIAVAGQNFIVAAPTNKLTTFNNATATSVTFSTAAEIIGAACEVVFDGTTYLCFLMTEETQTTTVG